ncbi:camphor resistance protein CrcB [Pseudonocardia thermophila]|uniref:Fluoride-specific ion channel FluC n=1 Tax=Pseudonocardia thermophila TaxID=1848 RepID=A0A1M6YKU6_PSETH|nr:CrcB family protein [Pseudonocardia thermophila]SHL18934.1 camphor resistance protein CrcB [Pseudonocardia thermophila]
MRSGDAGPTAQPAIAGAVAAGGVIGALARYGAGVALPTAAGAFPLTTFAVNVVGCALMGALVAALARTPGAHPLLRPFLGTGVLGGFTTFSAFAVETVELLSGPPLQVALGLLYAAGTVVCAVGAAALGALLVRP